MKVEAKLLEHPAVTEVAVLGVPDEAYGEVGAALVVVTDGWSWSQGRGGGGGGGGVDIYSGSSDVSSGGEIEGSSGGGGGDGGDGEGGGGGRGGHLTVTASALGAWAREHMSPYKVPRSFLFVEKIPRNAMGKVNKKSLRAQFFPGEDETATSLQ